MARDEQRSASSVMSRRLLAISFIAAGVNHFLMPRCYERIVPPPLRAPRARWSCGRAGSPRSPAASACCAPATRRLAGLGLVALLVAVFPANLHMAREPEHFQRIPRWALYARLPFQPLMMLWAWRATRDEPRRRRDAGDRASLRGACGGGRPAERKIPHAARSTLLCSGEETAPGQDSHVDRDRRQDLQLRAGDPDTTGSCEPGGACSEHTLAWPSGWTPSWSARTACR